MKKIAVVVVFVLLIFLVLQSSKSSQSNLQTVSNGVPTNTTAPKADTAKGINQTTFPLNVPNGFTLSVYAKNLGDPRAIIFDPQNSLLVSVPSKGKVLAFPGSISVAGSLNHPHGLALQCQKTCQLYIAETNVVSVFDYDQTTKKATNKRKIMDLPSGGGHTTRSLLITNNQLLVAIGSSCNVCRESDPKRASIWISDLDGANTHEFAKGLRNSVFMTKNPKTGDVWATEMGRDNLGDDTPPDEVNIIQNNKNYGWPICYGKNIHDSNFDKNQYIRNPCSTDQSEPSHIDIQAHSAPLGLAFVSNSSWPKNYQGNLIVAYHGSWNRSVPTGYKLVMLKLDSEGNFIGQEDFITGWLKGNSAAGRPVDIAFDNLGNAFISDDKAGIIYQLTYTGGN